MDPRDYLPLKDLEFRILVVLGDGERHGWSLGQALDDSSTGMRILPGQLYRTLDRMLADGLIDEHAEPRARAPKPTRGASPTRFFRLTALGRAVARAETDRLAALVERSRAGRLLKARR